MTGKIHSGGRKRRTWNTEVREPMVIKTRGGKVAVDLMDTEEYEKTTEEAVPGRHKPSSSNRNRHNNAGTIGFEELPIVASDSPVITRSR